MPLSRIFNCNSPLCFLESFDINLHVSNQKTSWLLKTPKAQQNWCVNREPEFFSKTYLHFIFKIEAMTLALFGFILVADFLLLLVIAVSILFPRSRIWPLPKKDSWQQWVSWSLFTVVMFGVPLLGALDFQSLGYSHWSHLVVGAVFFLVGLGIDIWGTRTLTAQQSLGEKGKIVTEGPYRYTRNPQYLGFIILFAGIIILAASLLALATGTFAIFLFFIIPFSEEPWLRQQYGEPYVQYCKNVPRFIGIRSFKPQNT
jgi:protein-S-isoprenylcysteine O-methyltransferase Ste14